jgi:hypothetical protein
VSIGRQIFHIFKGVNTLIRVREEVKFPKYLDGHVTNIKDNILSEL